MTKHFVMSARDSAADTFAQPFCAPSIGLATRNFADAVNRAGDGSPNPLREHPEDFELWMLGMFDDSDGSFETVKPHVVARAKDLKV